MEACVCLWINQWVPVCLTWLTLPSVVCALSTTAISSVKLSYTTHNPIQHTSQIHTHNHHIHTRPVSPHTHRSTSTQSDNNSSPLTHSIIIYLCLCVPCG